MTHCCACGNAPLLFPLERPPVCDGMVHVKIGRLTDGQLSFPVVYVNYVYVCTWREKVTEGGKGGKKAKESGKESEETSEGGEKADSYRWNSRLLASLPHTGSGLERHSGHGHTPWCSGLLIRNTSYFLAGWALHWTFILSNVLVV